MHRPHGSWLVIATVTCCAVLLAHELGRPLVNAQGLEPATPRAQPPRDATLACYQRAQEKTFLSENQALQLCRNAPTTAPVSCYERADQETFLQSTRIIELCRCARSTEPVDCFERADRETTLSERQILQMCAPIRVLNLWEDCIPRD